MGETSGEVLRAIIRLEIALKDQRLESQERHAALSTRLQSLDESVRELQTERSERAGAEKLRKRLFSAAVALAGIVGGLVTYFTEILKGTK